MYSKQETVLNCVWQGLSIPTNECSSLFPFSLFLVLPVSPVSKNGSNCVLHRASAQGKKPKPSLFMSITYLQICTEYRKSSPVFIATLSRGTGQLLEECERMLH